MKRISLLYFALSLVMAACDLLKTDENTPATGVYVANQGIFGQNNGSLTLHDLAANQTRQDILPNLTTLVQSVYLTETKGYLLANTGNRIDIFDPKTSQRTAQIENVPNPRYMEIVGSKAYVTDLYGNAVTILDLNAAKVTGKIPVGSNPEGIVAVGNRVYVANYGFGGSQTVSVVDAQTDKVIETLSVGCDGPRFLAKDAQNEVWVLCNGNTVYSPDYTKILSQTNGEAVVLQGDTGKVLKRVPLDAQLGAASLGQDAYYAASSQELYAIKGTSVLRFDTGANLLANTLTFDHKALIGALAYDAAKETLYLGRLDATNPYAAAGTVTLHNRSGIQTGQFAAGLIPTFIALK